MLLLYLSKQHILVVKTWELKTDCQSQSILALQVLQIEYGTDVSRYAFEMARLHPDNATGHVMLKKIIYFHNVTVDLYDVMEKDAKPASRSTKSRPGQCPVPIID